MRLSEFILANREPIIVEWEAFARTCSPASGVMDLESLRDHANDMLTVIARDLETPQTGQQQAAKSKGESDSETLAATAAGKHGAGRAESGFTMDQMVAEFRALRASVIRLWMAADVPGDKDVAELTRFNEAIDQALAESVSRYMEELDQSKEIFLAILGHDLRTPLGAVIMSADFMISAGELGEPYLSLTTRVLSSARRMEKLIGDLLDFTRSRLGGGIPITRAPMSMDKMVHDSVEEILAAHPERSIVVEARSGERGEWDCARLSQAFTNLVVNAIQHGEKSSRITATVRGSESDVLVSVHNEGMPISTTALNGLFNPMKSKGADTRGGSQGSLGLGLYIADRIVEAHEGRLEVESSKEGGTTFTMYIPRRPERRSSVSRS